MRVVRMIGAGVGILLVGLIALVLGLLVTNPQPEPAEGWTLLAELPFDRGEVGSTAATIGPGDGPQLVITGGIEGIGSTSDRVSVYDPFADRWEEGPRLPAPRHHNDAAAIDGDLYVSGGAASTSDWTPMSEVWRLATGAQVWDALEPMPEGRYGHRMVALGGRLYVVGGAGDSDDVLVWEPDRGWSRAATMPGHRHHLAVVAVDDEIWAIGGRDHDEAVLRDVDVYDPETDTWRDGPDLPFPVSAAAAGVIDGTIHIVGGEDPAVLRGGIVDRHLVLHPGEDRWSEAVPAPLSVHGAGSAVLDRRLFVAGGAGRQGTLSVLSWTGTTAAYDPDGASP